MSRPHSTSHQNSPFRGKPPSGEGRNSPTPTPGASTTSGLDNLPLGETRQGSETGSKKHKRKRNRNRKHRNRRPSFLAPEDSQPNLPATVPEAAPLDTMAENQMRARDSTPFYKLRGDLSNTSLESEALLDHRNQPMMRPRRDSRLTQSFRPGSISTSFRAADSNSRPFQSRGKSAYVEDSDHEEVDDRTPLMRPSSSRTAKTPGYGADSVSSPFTFRQRRQSTRSGSSQCSPREAPSHDINNPPSIPSTPKLGPDMGYNDAVMTGAEFEFSLGRSLENGFNNSPRPHDMVIDVDGTGQRSRSSPGSAAVSPHRTPQEGLIRRRTVPAEEDVCFPQEDVSEVAEECAPALSRGDGRRRRRAKEWPDLSVLEDWSREEKEERTGVFRTKKISEPMLVEGRLRPQYRGWRREEDEAPYRFTYFNEEFQSTIHAQTIPELVQPGGSFRELFIPDPPELEDSSDEEESDSEHRHSDHPTPSFRTANRSPGARTATPSNNHDSHPLLDGRSQFRTSIISEAVSEGRASGDLPRDHTEPAPKPKRYGPRPTFWLDVLCPTDAEMRVISKAFGIHALTAEDIMMQEAREKVELFRNYYFLNYRTFEQDPNSEDYLEPVNMYVVVFREGILSFHFSQTPHPANVRRRIRQLMDYLILSSDWISYAIIDDITDVFGPLIQAIEDEVDDVDEMIMKMHSAQSPATSSPKEEQEKNVVPGPGEMLRRVGVCRKKVMGLYRLLSNKADVVKGFAKRCNEHWEVAPKSEIGLYLGDIQDHIMTMTSSLTYYETLLSRAHSNYLAQINIHMNERQEQTADVLGKLTVLGTIVLPLNIICVMAGLILFAFASFLIAKRVYNIV
ncbi:hypothetical protein BJX76DRAFT_348405 [Aspergillus varians]